MFTTDLVAKHYLTHDKPSSLHYKGKHADRLHELCQHFSLSFSFSHLLGGKKLQKLKIPLIGVSKHSIFLSISYLYIKPGVSMQ